MLQKKTKLDSLHSHATVVHRSDMVESCENLYWFPQYLNEVCPFKNQYNCEWKKYLIWKNSETVRKSINSKERFTFYMPKIVKSIFNICKLFRQPPEVRYLAVDVLDRFLVEHFLEVRQTFECKMEDKSMESWQVVVERMLSQSLLRILTSVQLAMKYSWSTNVLTATDIQKMMEYLGDKKHYPKRSILKSEARVYRHLNYNVKLRLRWIHKNLPVWSFIFFTHDWHLPECTFDALLVSISYVDPLLFIFKVLGTLIYVQISIKTPFTYLEMFFEDFQKRQFFNGSIPLHSLFITCINVLDVAIIFHKQIYNNLTDAKENLCIVPCKANFIVLAASVIFASSVLEDPSAITSKILLQTLCSTGECRKSEIENLGKELLNIVLNI